MTDNINVSGNYNIHGFDGPGFHLKGQSLAQLLMADFIHIMNSFKKGLANHGNQMEVMKNLQKSTSTLLTLINEVSNPAVNLTTLAQKLTAQAQVVKADIDKISNGVYKAELEKALSSVLALFQNKVQFAAVTKWYRDLKAFMDFMNKGIYNDNNKDAASKLISLVQALNSDAGDIKNLYNELQKHASPGIDSTLIALKALNTSVQNVWAKIISIRAHTDQASVWESGSMNFGDFINNDKKIAMKKASLFLTEFHNFGGSDGHSGLWPFHNYLKGLDEAENMIKGFQEKKRPDLKISLITYLKFMRLAIDNPNQRVALEDFYNRFLEVTDGLNRINSESASVSEQITTSIYQAMATINAVAKVFTNMINIPIQIDNLAISYMNKDY